MTCVERAIACFLAQDYADMQLVIYNTDTSYPIELGPSFDGFSERILVVNNDLDSHTCRSYTNVGAIRRDALAYADGDLYITWDDDDLYFPWDARQRVDGIKYRSFARAWKPRLSFMKQRGSPPTLEFNYMEASIAVYLADVRRYGFNMNKNGAEHLGWFDALDCSGRLYADPLAVPGYCFYWADAPEVGGQKQSDMREFSRADNFERHKVMTTDRVTRPLVRREFGSYQSEIEPFIEPLLALEPTHKQAFDKYVRPWLASS